MSLVTTASAWISEDSSNKKRTPSLRKPSALSKSIPEDGSNSNKHYQSMKPSTIEEVEAENDNRNNRVNMLLDKITSATDVQDTGMGKFNPISHPAIQPKRDIGDNVDEQQYMPPIPRFKNEGTASNIYGGQHMPAYGANDAKAPVYSNYDKSYGATPQFTRPYYANMGINASGGGDSKLLEKINYMIHLLEQQQHEKTDNITEEFILYSFLGIFIIFVVDSFARAGKYTR
jgi:hypothetical protein